jgi:uncharacterized membrane protein
LINYRKQLASDSITLDLQLPKCSANSDVNIQIGSGVIQSFKIESDEKKSIKLNYSINGESEQYLNFFIEGSGTMTCNLKQVYLATRIHLDKQLKAIFALPGINSNIKDTIEEPIHKYLCP